MPAYEPCPFRAILVLHKTNEAADEISLGWVFTPILNDAE